MGVGRGVCVCDIRPFTVFFLTQSLVGFLLSFPSLCTHVTSEGVTVEGVLCSSLLKESFISFTLAQSSRHAVLPLRSRMP